MTALADGDHLFFTDWRGDPDEQMRDDGPTVAELFSAAAKRGVVVKGLMWRSHLDKLAYSEEENRNLGDDIAAAGGEVLLDQRVRRGGSHHQKLVVLRHPGRRRRTSPSPAASTCVTAGATTPSTTATRSRSRCPARTGRIRPGTTCSSRCAARSSARSTCRSASGGRDPTPLDSHGPISTLQDKLRHADLSADRLPDAAAGPAGVRPARHPGAAHLPGDAPAVRVRAARRATIARGYTKAVGGPAG